MEVKIKDSHLNFVYDLLWIKLALKLLQVRSILFAKPFYWDVLFFKICTQSFCSAIILFRFKTNWKSLTCQIASWTRFLSIKMLPPTGLSLVLDWCRLMPSVLSSFYLGTDVIDDENSTNVVQTSPFLSYLLSHNYSIVLSLLDAIKCLLLLALIQNDNNCFRNLQGQKYW